MNIPRNNTRSDYYRISLGVVEREATTEHDSPVHHMEIDMKDLDHIIFTDGPQLSGTDASATTAIVGSFSGYKEGSSFEAQFKTIYGFTQLQNFSIVICDPFNARLRLFDRTAGFTYYLYGGDSTASFTPSDVILNSRYKDRILVAELGHDRISEFNLVTWRMNVNKYGLTTVNPELVLGNIFAMAYNSFENEGDLYVGGMGYIAKLGFTSSVVNKFFGGAKAGDKDGTFEEALVNYPTSLVFLAADLILFMDERSRKLKIADLTERNVLTLCGELECDYGGMQSLLIKDDLLLVGHWRKIAYIQYQKKDCKWNQFFSPSYHISLCFPRRKSAKYTKS